MRIAALDISKNNVGIAFSDSECLFIAKETTLNTKNKSFFKERLKKIFIEYQPSITYIGLPIHIINNKNARFVKQFTHEIRHIIGKFKFVDESFSTFYIEQLIKEGSIKMFDSIDSAVARCIVLQKMHENRNQFIENPKITERNDRQSE
jgi:RNase H-fold protein (predicted Holliday junction resolvase)